VADGSSSAGFRSQDAPSVQQQQPQAAAAQPYVVAGAVAHGQGNQVIMPKSPVLPMVVSFFFPGVGSMLVGRAGMGVIIFGLYAVDWLFFWALSLLTFGIGSILTIPFFMGTCIWGLVDAYNGTRAWNARHGIIS
jgi:hypothetical protein